MNSEELPDGVPAVHDITHEELNMLQLGEYRDHRLEVLSWLWHEGKDPDRAEGYSEVVLELTSYRLSKIYRWIWEEEGYTTFLTHDHGDTIVDKLRTRDTSDVNKSQYVKALKRYFKWRTHEKGADEWEPEETYAPGQQTHHARDYFTRDERQLLRQATLDYASLPAYSHATPEERDRWKIYLAQRLEKPKNEVTPEDWEDATSWKIPSVVAVSLDGGLRPIEVERARVQWVDLENSVLRIPKEEDSKPTGGGENWTVSLREDTTRKLARWLEERVARPKYDGRDEIWLTSQENSFGSRTLNYHLEKICELAGISTENRDLSWYSIRHSTGTYMTREEGLAAAQAQLRHRSEQTTMRYDHAPPEDRRDALDKM